MKFQFKKININKSTVLLGIAILVGLLAALAAKSYLSNRMNAIEAQSKSNLVNVVVAKAKLQKGDVISSETVAVRGVPSDYAHSNALMPNQFDTFDGRKRPHSQREWRQGVAPSLCLWMKSIPSLAC
jgi:pilus assembly protein CpaB